MMAYNRSNSSLVHWSMRLFVDRSRVEVLSFDVVSDCLWHDRLDPNRRSPRLIIPLAWNDKIPQHVDNLTVDHREKGIPFLDQGAKRLLSTRLVPDIVHELGHSQHRAPVQNKRRFELHLHRPSSQIIPGSAHIVVQDSLKVATGRGWDWQSRRICETFKTLTDPMEMEEKEKEWNGEQNHP